jgi:HEAT repeat protein
LAEPQPSVDELLARLASDDRTEQRLACDAAAALLKLEPRFQNVLNRVLLDGTPRARFAAAWVLFHVHGPSLRHLPALLDALECSDGDVRWSATHMLATLGRLKREAVEVLLHEAREAEAALRRRMALYAIREVAPERSETRAVVLSALDDADPGVRRAALTSLAKLTEPDAACLDRALDALDQVDDPAMRRIAAVLIPGLLEHQPERRSEALARLEAAQRHDDPALARAAEAALSRLR